MATPQTRFSTLLPLDSLPKVAVIGVGAIGRQVALTLDHMGLFETLYLYDFDEVAIHNIGTQGWLESDIDHPKVESLHLRTNDAELVNREWNPDDAANAPVTFLCVDSIDTRRDIWRYLSALWSEDSFMCDGRMAAESMRILTVTSPDDHPAYDASIFPASETQGEACTARSTFYCAAIAAGIMISNYARWLRNLSVCPDLVYDLRADDLFPAPCQQESISERT